MMNYLKSKFKKQKSAAEKGFYTPLRVALHSTLRLNTVDMVTLNGIIHPLFVQPSGSLEVLAIGNFDMGGTQVHQIYVKDEAEEEYILQVVEGNDYRSGDVKVDEVTLYKQVVTLEPDTEDSLNRVLNDIGFLNIKLDGIEYDRIWGDQFTEKMDFRHYNETVQTPTGTDHYENNYLLYGREVESMTGDKVAELLLVGLEESDDEAQVMMQLGLQLNINDIEVV